MATRRTQLFRAVVAAVAVAVVSVPLLPTVGSAAPSMTLDQAKARMNALDAQAEQAQEQLNTVNLQVALVQRQLVEVQAQVARSQAALGQLQGLVGTIAADAYRSGGVDMTLQLLLAPNPADFLDQAATLNGVSAHDNDLLGRTAFAEQRLSQDKLSVAQKLGQLQQLRSEAATFHAAVQAKADQATQVFNDLSAQLKAQFRAQQAADAAAARARAQQFGRASRSNHGGSGYTPVNGTDLGARAVRWALSKVGDSYVWGASGPHSFDCSGLTMAAYASVGVYLPHSSSAQFGSGRHISSADLQPGDLVFFYSPIHHVGMYIGGGMIVHAANPSDGVLVSSLSSMPYSGAVRPY